MDDLYSVNIPIFEISYISKVVPNNHIGTQLEITIIIFLFYLQHHSKRLIIFGWWIFAILVFATYAVTLAPLMTSNNNNAMFKYDSIDAMLQDPDFKFKTYPNGSTHSLLKVQ